jgi:REP element-mobilizing transposase RayT
MAKPLLIVTPHNSFGSMLRSSLEETSQFRVFNAGDEQAALVQIKNDDCEMAFLDVDLGVDAILNIGHALRTSNANAELVIVSDEDLPSALDELRPWTLLLKPFYLPELMDLLSTIPANEKPKPVVELPPNSPVSENPDLVWLQDVNKAAQRLTRLTLESSAQAALITRGKSLWAYAGGLSQETANELVQIVSRSSDEQNGGDLLRFARLETTRAEHMLYATTLAEGVVLALVFDAETPFSTIRSQANLLARSLEVEKTGAIKPSVPEPTPNVRVNEPVSNPRLNELVPDVHVTEPVPTDESDVGMPTISEIISDIPVPIPKPAPRPVATPTPAPQPALRVDAVNKAEADVKKIKADQSTLETRASAPLSDAHVISRESPLFSSHDSTVGETVRQELQGLDVTVPTRAKRPATPVRPPQPGEMDETRPHLDAEVDGIIGLEPASPALYKLNYACLLVPRLKMHYLAGDVASELSEFLPYICVAFGWRLEFMAVRPEYLQWVVSVPPNTAPGHVMRVIREQTSEKLFKEFPRMEKENPSGDFWAPGYLIMGGTQPHPQQLVKEYIKQTRDRQGNSQVR